MSRVCLLLARFSLSAWVGAAVLFVINGVREVTSSNFDSAIRDQLVVLRFPAYYEFGFVLMGLAFVCLLAALFGRVLPRGRHVVAIVLVGVSLAVMCYDYRAVYRPLEEMITPAGQVRPMGFRVLHERSKTINTVHIGISLVAALMTCWPVPVARRVDAAADEQ